MPQKNAIFDKLYEASASVLPIALIVVLVCFLFVPVSSGLMLSFLLGAVLLIVGMGLFTLGADTAMSPIGNAIGAKMTQSRKLWLILFVSLALGTAITMAEPDLRVLADSVPAIDTQVLIMTVSIGVGLFLMLCMLRILFSISLRILLIVFYALIFLGVFFIPEGMIPLAFDSGGVTTGPMTVPFIMALGIGVAAIRSDENAKADSFGLVGLCSVGPVLAVMILSVIFQPDTGYTAENLKFSVDTTTDIGYSYIASVPTYIGEVALALLPIFAFFLIFQVISLRIKRQPFMRIIMGIVFTYVGLVLFLTGVNVGFSPLGTVLGALIAQSGNRWLLIPLAMLMGWYIINAEPAVHVLNRQVEELSVGAISAKAMGLCLSIAVASANGLAMLRVLTGISILWFLVPGYAIALCLSLVVPRTFTAIAFDSGGVASGPLTATFMLPFAVGACQALGGDVMSDAFGLVALVALMPLITVQAMGAISMLRQRRSAKPQYSFADDDIIELWEVA